jgi:hypothetical protein
MESFKVQYFRKEKLKMSIETKLELELDRDFDKLDDLEVGTEQHTEASKVLIQLLDRKIEMDKFESEMRDKEETRKIETELKRKQMDDDRKDRLIRNCLTGVSIISGVGVTVWGALKSWKFEETGVVTSTAGRKFISNLFSKK